MKSLTDLGDLAVLLPLSLVVLVWLLAMRTGKGAIWWVIALGVCIGGTSILKMYFSSCPIGSNLHSPSGHGSFSTLAYGALAAIIAIEVSVPWQRKLAVGSIGLLVAGIAVSRLALGAHTGPELALGLLLGMSALAVFAHGYRRDGPNRVSLLPLLFGAVLVIALFHGREIHAEGILGRLGLYFHIQAGPRMCI